MIALVSDAGMPAICDPGWRYGPFGSGRESAYRSLAGSQCRPYGAHCFGDEYDEVHLCRVFAENPEASTAGPAVCGSYEGTLIFYEAPHRIRQVLGEMKEVLGDRKAVLCRELTKRYEQ